MEEERADADKIKRESNERALRIVVDERLPDGSYRILISKARPGVGGDQRRDATAWEEEEAQYIDSKHLSALLPGKRVANVTEGRVYEVEKGVSSDVYENAREHMKTKTARLLLREGKSMGKTIGGR